MVNKRKLANGKFRVTFSMPALDGVTRLNLVGDFNVWSETSTPMAQAADGSWNVALSLEGDREYQYRYLADGATWHNDWAADAYVPNVHGTQNSLLNLKVKAKPAAAPRKKAPAKKKA